MCNFHDSLRVTYSPVASLPCVVRCEGAGFELHLRGGAALAHEAREESAPPPPSNPLARSLGGASPSRATGASCSTTVPRCPRPRPAVRVDDGGEAVRDDGVHRGVCSFVR